MAAASQQPLFEDLMRDIAHQRFKPVYLLMGAENYYIDCLVDAIIKNALTEDEQAFNLSVYYGMDTDLANVINRAKSYPMGAERSVVVLKEAQHLKNLDLLGYYMQNPQMSTIFVITYKNGTIDGRKSYVKSIQSMGVVYESKKPVEAQLPNFVTAYVEGKGFGIEKKAAMMIADSIGTDLNRLYGELDKLMIAVPQSCKKITPEMVEANIGISKDYNYFELQNAIVEKDIFKANQIIKYFDSNPKAFPIQALLPMLFRFFSSVLSAYYSPDKSERGLAAFLSMKDWQVRRNIIPVLQKYSAKKVLYILDEIRSTDEKSKGMNGSKVSSGDLMKELLFFILH